MVTFFDVHHHHSERSNGIFNVDSLEKVPKNYFSIGLHPKEIQPGFEKTLAKVREISLQENCVAIGECGLDSLINVDKYLQERVFGEQIIWANEIQKPVIIHCVKQFSELLKFQKIAKIPLIVHGFNKRESIAKELINKGFYLSFGKSLLYNTLLQEVVKGIPLGKVFLETDVWEGEIEEVYRKLAEIRNIDVKALIEQINKNMREVFRFK